MITRRKTEGHRPVESGRDRSTREAEAQGEPLSSREQKDVEPEVL